MVAERLTMAMNTMARTLALHLLRKQCGSSGRSANADSVSQGLGIRAAAARIQGKPIGGAWNERTLTAAQKRHTNITLATDAHPSEHHLCLNSLRHHRRTNGSPLS